MNIGIDIDDTITDSFEYLMKSVSEYFNIDIKYLEENEISYINLPEKYKKYEKQFAKACYAKALPNIPVKEGAQEYINKIKSMGNKIIIITARDKNLYDDPYFSTENQLKGDNINYDKLICTFDKVKACKDEKVELFIDDSINNCKNVKKAGINTVLFTSKLNRKENINIPRVSTWKEVYEYIKNNQK